MIARAIRLAQAASFTTSTALLVGFNLIPLAGVVLWGWNVATLLVLYWVENGIVGLLNIPKMLLASGPISGGPGATTVAISSLLPSGAAKAALVAFYLIHYGLFWLVHGVFVFALINFAGALSPHAVDGNSFFPVPGQLGFDPPLGVLDVAPGSGPDLSAVGWGAIGLFISHVASFIVNFVGKGEYRKVSVAQQMFAPYGRLVILHLTILFGGFASIALGSPVGAVIVLVLLKTGVDLSFHLREHGRLTSAPLPRSGTAG